MNSTPIEYVGPTCGGGVAVSSRQTEVTARCLPCVYFLSLRCIHSAARAEGHHRVAAACPHAYSLG
ncbi:MAG: hypothetical protein HY985_03435 [Magnetospirillum sp.]|nr:hypothetical protein [Magnetospirillum sp.]